MYIINYNKIIFTVLVQCPGDIVPFSFFNLYADFHIFPFVNFRENIIERR